MANTDSIRRARFGSRHLIGGAEDDSGVRERASCARGDGDEVALSLWAIAAHGTGDGRRTTGKNLERETGIEPVTSSLGS